jgi:hypothetical protein
MSTLTQSVTPFSIMRAAWVVKTTTIWVQLIYSRKSVAVSRTELSTSVFLFEYSNHTCEMLTYAPLSYVVLFYISLTVSRDFLTHEDHIAELQKLLWDSH